MKKICICLCMILSMSLYMIKVQAKMEIKDHVLISYSGTSKTITIPDDIERIDDQAFLNNTSIEKVIMGNKVKQIGDYAFKGCKNLRSITLSDQLETLGLDVFYNCRRLNNIHIPSSLKKVDTCFGTFANTSITNVTFDKNVKKISDYLFYRCESLKEVDLENIESIGEYAFYGCSGLTSISFSKCCKQIGTCAFSKCIKLKQVKLVNGLTRLDSDVFYGCASLNSIYIPSTLKDCSSLYGIFANTSLEEVIFDEECKVIPAYLFYGASSLENVTLPYSLTSIDDYAFCKSGIQSIELVDSIEHIGKYAFSQCRNLNDVKLSNHLNCIEDDAFYGCMNLDHITIPSSLYKVSGVKGIFANTSLNKVTFEKGCTSIPSHLFYGVTSLSKISLPSSIESIGKSAFEGCNHLKSIIIPDQVKKIDAYAFSDCTSLTNVKLSKNLKTLGSDVFAGCIQLTSIHIPKSLNSCDGMNGIFYNTSLASVTFENGIEEIPEALFMNIHTLEKISIPKTIQHIHAYAFAYNPNLKKVNIPSTVNSISSFAFSDSPNVCLYVGKNSFAYNYAKKFKLAYKIANPPITAIKLQVDKLSATSVVLKWNEAKDCDGYQIYRGDSKSATYKKAIDTKKTSAEVKNLITNQNYYVKIRGYIVVDGKKKYSAFSRPIKIKPVLSKVTCLIKSYDHNDIILTWNKSAGAKFYEIYRKNGRNQAYRKIKTTNSLNYVDHQVILGNTYSYKVVACIKQNNQTISSAFSNVESAKPQLKTPSLSMSRQSKNFILSWKSISGASMYRIERSKSKSGTYRKFKDIKNTNIRFEYVKNTGYYYRIKAYKTINGKNIYSPVSNVILVNK